MFFYISCRQNRIDYFIIWNQVSVKNKTNEVTYIFLLGTCELIIAE